MVMKDETRLKKFWEKVDKTEECWLWTGAWDHQFGYGNVRRNGKVWRAHRWIFVQLNGWEPEVVMHTCDNPRCVRPDHLQGGTYLDNNLDMVAKGRRRGPTYPDTCPKGHNDWYYRKRLTFTARECRVCRTERQRQRRESANSLPSEPSPQGFPS